MSGRPLDLVIFGLSLSSAWGNGHATTYRALIKGLAAEGHRVLFLERDAPWYAPHRDLPAPEFCEFELYDDLDRALDAHAARIARADAVIVGTYVPEGAALIDRLAARRPRRLCFYDIDTPVTLAGLARGEETHLAARQVPEFDLYLSFSGGRALERLERSWGARRAEALFCAVDPELYRPTGEPPRWDLGYLGTYSPDRQPMLERLLLAPARARPDLRFVVAGPQYPDDIDWPANVERIEHLPPSDHAAFYSRQRLTLNVTRAAMVESGLSPSVRLFEAAACGTPILSDPWEGIEALFPPGEAILLASSEAEALEALALDEGARAGIAERARQIVLAAHTGQARARRLVELIEEIPLPSPIPGAAGLRAPASGPGRRPVPAAEAVPQGDIQ